MHRPPSDSSFKPMIRSLIPMQRQRVCSYRPGRPTPPLSSSPRYSNAVMWCQRRLLGGPAPLSCLPKSSLRSSCPHQQETPNAANLYAPSLPVPAVNSTRTSSAGRRKSQSLRFKQSTWLCRLMNWWRVLWTKIRANEYSGGPDSER